MIKDMLSFLTHRFARLQRVSLIYYEKIYLAINQWTQFVYKTNKFTSSTNQLWMCEDWRKSLNTEPKDTVQGLKSLGLREWGGPYLG